MLLFGGETAVDRDGLTGDIRRCFRCEKNRDAVQVRKLTITTNGRHGGIVTSLLGIGKDRRGEFRREKARCNGVRGNPVLRPRFGHRTGQLHDPAFRCAIGHAVGKSTITLQGRNVDDAIIAGTHARARKNGTPKFKCMV